MQNINYNQEIENITNWIQKIVSKSGFKKIVIGLSGGVDSAVSCALAVKAIGQKSVLVAMLPNGELNREGLKDARLVTEFLQIPEEQIFVIDIKEAAEKIASSCSPRNDMIRKGNIMARVRMIYLFDLAKQHRALVCGTENKSEHYLGYFTRFGDEASDIEPIVHLYKTQVWEIAKSLGLPEKIITKAPTAGLWEEQTDEKELGFSYKDADEVLAYFIDEKLSKEEIMQKKIDKNVVENVIKRVKENEFKHRLPFVYK